MYSVLAFDAAGSPLTALMAVGGLWPLTALFVFWGGVLLVGFTLMGYGALIQLLARVRPRAIHRSTVRPIVTVVVVAYNEGGRIAAKIENLLSLDYPRDRLEIVIASDGSTDDTVLRARAFEPRIRVVAFRDRRGKPAVLNEVVPKAKGTVVVLADTRQRFERGALMALVQGFADPVVGAVSGELILLKQGEDENVAGGGAALYWDREKRIRFNESVFDSTVGATGAIYAVRRDLFETIPSDTILDDVLIPMRIARQGYRVLFEPAAKAFDHRSTSARQEFVRKVRTIAGNFQLFAREPWLLNPFSNRLWFQTMSHKALRLLLPALFLGALAANCLLFDHWFYKITLAGQLLFLAVAGITSIAPSARRAIPGAVLPYTICFLCFATIVGFLRFMTGRQAVTWDRSSPALDAR